MLHPFFAQVANTQKEHRAPIVNTTLIPSNWTRVNVFFLSDSGPSKAER